MLGADPQHAGGAWRARIGVVLQESEPERDLSVLECLQLYAGYYPRPRDVAKSLELVALSDRADAVASRLSGGQRRRLDVALALIGNPELLFLDEPTTGFDPSARRAAWEMVAAGLRALGMTVFLTTHYMDEAEYLADRVAVIAAGRIVAEGTPGTLGGRATAAVESRFCLPAGVEVTDLPDAVQACIVDRSGTRLVLKAQTPLDVLGPVVPWAQGHGYDLADLDIHRPSLEDIYLQLTSLDGTAPL